MGVVPPADGFLRALREVCIGPRRAADLRRSDFRISRGGRAARRRCAGVRPDLTCLGKIIGGGLPVGAYGGRADLMELVSPAGPVYQAGTLSGNPLAMTAGLWASGAADTAALSHARGARHAARRGACRRRARRGRGAAGQRVRIAAHAVLHRPARPRLRVGDQRRHRQLRAVLPRDARARRLSAAVAVRGVVPVGGAHGDSDVDKTIARGAGRRCKRSEIS